MILVYISPTFNAYSQEELEDLSDSFNVEMDPDVGGSCNANIQSTGEELVARVIAAFGDALGLITAGLEEPNKQIDARDTDEASAQTFTRLRGMLFVFFGISISSAGQFNEENLEAYNNMLGKLINPRSFSKSAWLLIPAIFEQTNSERWMLSITIPRMLLGTETQNFGVWKTTQNSTHTWPMTIGF